jgi:hypothetical protein
MKKQTAVEWLVEQLPLIQQEGLRDIWEQAKAMEKEQIFEAYIDVADDDTNRRLLTIAAEQYYNEIYGGDK